ncbi:MAG: protein translocase SEC61 complex subunit gamma [Candidatus Diapherotrites archaeon]|nr:protein translocase SEC61 complex subunit gamma [Candidatus Diapherotrites archaeon]
MIKKITKSPAKVAGLISGLKKYLKTFYASSRRVLKISKKPTGTEFKRIAKITGVGSFLIGMVGFVIYLIFNLSKLFI